MRLRFGLAAAALALGFVPAAADPFQDFAQCAQITSNELRLICYDAAARALGGLPPAAAPMAASPAAAPQAGAIEPASPGPAQAAMAAPPPAAPAAAIVVPKKKSKGWFGLFGGSKEETPAQTAAAAPPPASPEASFGASRLPKTATDSAKPRDLSSIRSPITDYAYTPLGRIIVFLENGQVWRQIDGDTKRMRLRKGQSYTAEIEKGILGSFDLAVDGIDGFVKVTRIK